MLHDISDSTNVIFDQDDLKAIVTILRKLPESRQQRDIDKLA